MLQVLPLIVYFGAQKLAEPDMLGSILPKAIVGWFPALAALLCYIVTSQMQQAQATKATAALVGAEAPDVAIEFMKEGKKSLRELIKDSKHIDRLAADPKYKGKVNFVLCNMASLEDAEKYSKQQGLKGSAMHGCGQPPAEYGIMYIPHKVLIDKEGKVVKNFKVDLPGDLDALLAN